jgi:replication factor C subunit 1
MNIVCSGQISEPTPSHAIRHKVLRKGYTLHVGTHCNDGRPITESARYKEAVRLGIPIVRHGEKDTVKEHHDLWTDQYAPRALNDVIGHKDSIAQLKEWIQTWPASGKAALITGPPGIGKSTVAHLIAKENGYIVAEYNASDTRSVSMLRGILGLGIKRLRKELIIMDEVDGFSAQDRGGVGELAQLIRSSHVPIICIANQTPPKLKPLLSACNHVRFSRPVKSTIATALLHICKKEKLTLTKIDLETMCETGGNDIRSILNQLQFKSTNSSQKDATLRLDLFSATQKLMSYKRTSLNDAEDFVYVDYGMVPLMVQEAYLSASRTLEEAVDASEQVSFGDIVSSRQWKTQDWSLLPHVVHSTVATTRKISGPCPFQIFPKLLGQNSKKMKHRRWMEEIGRLRGRTGASTRLVESEPIRNILLRPLTVLKGEKSDSTVIQSIIHRMDHIRLSKEHLDNLAEIGFSSMDVPTKVKTAFTREYNKGHTTIKKSKSMNDTDEEDVEEEEEDDEPIDELID